MTESETAFDAIVIGAGHNGLAAAVLLQKAGLRTVCLDAKLYAGGMASTVELFDGYQFEIAGSVQFPTASVVVEELGLDTLPTIDLDVMSVALRGVGDDPLVQYSDPIKLFTHLNEVHGADAVNGMAGLMAWSQAPTRALGRFEAGMPPKTFDEMYACATNEFERSAIDDMLFGSVTDVLDRYLPDREKHGALRGSMTVLAVNTLYRGPATPGSAAALAFGLGVPDGDTMQMKKLRGGIGALTAHLCRAVGKPRRRSAAAHQGDRNPGRRRAGDRSAHRGGGDPERADRRLRHRARRHAQRADRSRGAARRHPGTLRADRPPRQLPADALRAGRGPRVRRALRGAQRPGHAGVDRPLLHPGGGPAAVGGLPARDRSGRPDGGVADPVAERSRTWRPRASTPRRRSRCGSRSRAARTMAQAKVEMGQRVIDKITRLAPNFERSIIRHTTFTPKHMGVMFGAPGGDYCHGLLNSDQIGPNRPGPKGFLGQPIPIDGLYLGSAGCHGGPGITFIPGYNAARAALADLGR